MKGVEDHPATAMGSRGQGPAGILPDSPRVHICLFGKHRVWRDFVSLNAANDPVLTRLYESIYCRCLNAVQTGVWGTDLATVVPRFGHLMISLNSLNDVVVGTLIGSADSLGRRQPLMLAARVEGMPYHRSLPCLAPMIRNLTNQVLEVADEATVLQTLRRSEAWFTVRLESAPPALPDHVGQLLRGLLAEPSVAAAGEGLHRIIYQVIGHDPTGIDAPWQTPPGLTDHLPAQIRIELDPNSPEQGIERWLCMLHFLCGEVYPLTAFAPFDRPWSDVIVGALGDAEIATLLKLPEEENGEDGKDVDADIDSRDTAPGSADPEPYTHCIPFNLDVDFRARVAAFREQAQNPSTEPGEASGGDRSRMQDMQTAIVDVSHSVQTSLSPVFNTALARRVLVALAVLAAVIILSFGAFRLLKHLSRAAIPLPRGGRTALVASTQGRGPVSGRPPSDATLRSPVRIASPQDTAAGHDHPDFMGVRI